MARRPSPGQRHVGGTGDSFASIKVVGVGGSGGAALNRMAASRFSGVELVAVNTDAQALRHNDASVKIHIGQQTTRGLGAGMNPDVGRTAAEENLDDIAAALQGADMVFVTCGLGGGTGTGAAPVIADLARQQGALTVGVVTKPFSFEGAQRRRLAEEGHSQLAERVDAIITIPNDRILQIIDRQTSLLNAFSIVDEVLKQGVQGIAEVISIPGLVNVDFADVKAIMQDSGSALMGIGRGSGESRARDAARSAIDSPLLELSVEGAKGVLFTITGGPSLTMFEVNEAAEVITQAADPDAKIIFGAGIDESLGDEVRVTVIATGFAASPLPAPRSREAVAKPSYTQNAALRRQEREVKPEPRREAKLPERPASPEPRAEVANEPRFTERPLGEGAPLSEEELEVPAFLRKKLG